MFEQTRGVDLSKNNPWLDSSIKNKRKKVCFTVTEMSPPQLPHCRRVDNEGTFGHLHSKKCGNYEELYGADLCKRAHSLTISNESLSSYIIHQNENPTEKCVARKREPSLLSITKYKLDQFLDVNSESRSI